MFPLNQFVIQERLRSLCELTGYEIIQHNGQRIYKPPAGRDLIPPERGSEVFVGKIPKDMLEDELVPIFTAVGPIYKLRLMLGFDGRSRGYCFVSYYESKHANAAIAKLNEYKVRSTRSIVVHKSVDNRRLFIGNVPRNKTKEELLCVLNWLVEGVADVILYQSWENPLENRGYVFVEFESHHQAALARKMLSPGCINLWGVPFIADWAEPIPEVNPVMMPLISKLFIRNIDIELSYQQTFSAISKFIPVGTMVVKLYKKFDYAFVHFPNNKQAEIALQALQGKTVGTKQIEVSWARPPIYSKANRITRPPPTLCMAVPPALRRQVVEIKSQLKLKFSAPYVDQNDCFSVVQRFEDLKI